MYKIKYVIKLEIYKIQFYFMKTKYYNVDRVAWNGLDTQNTCLSSV